MVIRQLFRDGLKLVMWILTLTLAACTVFVLHVTIRDLVLSLKPSSVMDDAFAVLYNLVLAIASGFQVMYVGVLVWSKVVSKAVGYSLMGVFGAIALFSATLYVIYR